MTYTHQPTLQTMLRLYLCVRRRECVFTPPLPVCLSDERSGRRVVDGGKGG